MNASLANPKFVTDRFGKLAFDKNLTSHQKRFVIGLGRMQRQRGGERQFCYTAKRLARHKKLSMGAVLTFYVGHPGTLNRLYRKGWLEIVHDDDTTPIYRITELGWSRMFNMGWLLP